MDTPLRRVAIVGAGTMGSALLAAWAAAESDEDFPRLALEAVETDAEARARLNLSSVTVYDSVAAIANADCVVFAVKPQVLDAVLTEWRAHCLNKGATAPLVVSIAAGVATETIEAALPKGVAVVRTMPNLALTVGRSVTAICGGAAADEAEIAFVETLFDAVGSTFRVDESLMDAVCALSGSGPAYFALLAEAMAEAGGALDLEEDLARDLAAETLIGTAALLRERSLSPEELRRRVTSPHGTTEAGVAAMREAGFEAAVASGVTAAWRRGRELGREARS